MKIKIGTIENYTQKLNQFLKDNTEKLPPRFDLYVCRNLRIFEDELIEYRKRRDDLIKKYGEEDSAGYSIDTNNKEAFNAFLNELKEYQDVEVDVDYKTVPIDILDSILLPVSHMQLIEFMIDE